MDNNQDQGHDGHAFRCGETVEGNELSVSERQTHDPHSQGPKSLDTGNNEKFNVGTGEILSCSSGDELFLDANANFSDGAPSPGSKEPLRDSLDSATNVEIGNIKYQAFSSESSSDFNGQMQDPSILQRERVKEGNMLELQGQLSGSQVDPPSSSSITDLRTIEDRFGLSSDSNPSKAEAAPDMLLENKIYAGENVRPCILASVAKETNLKENDETKSDSDMFDIAIFSNNTVNDKVAVNDVVNLGSQVARGAFNLEEKNNAELLSVIPQEELSLEVNSTISSKNTSTNGVQLKSARTIQFATSGDVKTLQEMGEENVNMFTSPVCDDSVDVTHPQNECADFKDHKGVLPQNSLSLSSSEAGKPKQDDLMDSDDDDNYCHINQSHLSEKREVLPPDGGMEEQESWEFVTDEMHDEESIGVSSVKFMTESDKTSDEIGASMNCMKFVMIEDYLSNFSDGVCKSDDVVEMDKFEKCDITDAQYTGRPIVKDSSLPVTIEDYPSNFSDGVYKSDDVVEMDKFEIYDITDAQYTGRPIVKDSSLPKPAGSYFECSILSEKVAINFYARTPKDIESAINKSTLSGAQEATEDDEINSSCRVNKECNRFISTSADSHQTQNAELLVKAAEEPGRNDSSLCSLDVELSAQCVSVVRKTQGEVSGITAVPVQDQSGNQNNNVQLPSSAIHTSIDYGIQCDSLEGNRDSVSGIPSNLNDPYEVQKGLNQQHPSSTSSQAGWFTALITQITNESQGRKKNEEIIAEITNNRTSEQQTPLQSPLIEAAHSNNKPESPKLEERPVFGKNGESAAAAAAKAVVKGEGEKGSNSSADIKRQNKKVESKVYYCPPFWCCLSVDSPPRDRYKIG